jgi:hypothetical protein
VYPNASVDNPCQHIICPYLFRFPKIRERAISGTPVADFSREATKRNLEQGKTDDK